MTGIEKIKQIIDDVIILGAGASGLMAAIHAAGRGRRVLVLDHAKRAGKKILVSGGGKCNITNRQISVSDYFGADNAFCKYALKRFTTNIAELGKKDRKTIAECVHSFPVVPDSIEGFSKAEATLGGVSTDEINPKSMESLLHKGLFFSGEVIDITGRLGGYNIHWAFASGTIAGQNI